MKYARTRVPQYEIIPALVRQHINGKDSQTASSEKSQSAGIGRRRPKYLPLGREREMP
jgi:hypothetical protein